MKNNPYKGKRSKFIIEDMKQLYCSIYISQCYNTRDLVLFYKAIQELEKRGYKVDEKNSFIYAKKLHNIT